MILEIQIPGKTFLVGEYLAMKTGESVVLTNSPLFTLKVDSTDEVLSWFLVHLSSELNAEFNLTGASRQQQTEYLQKFELHASAVQKKQIQEHFKIFHPQSPAGQFIFRHLQLFSLISIGWHDPYQNSGGLGASTAQYIGVISVFYFLLNRCDQKHNFDFLNMNEIAVAESSPQAYEFIANEKIKSVLLKNYQIDAWNGQGLKPSGQDFLAQLFGGLNWCFPELALLLVRTGVKLATHQHLQSLQEFEIKYLQSSYQLVLNAIQTNDADLLIKSVNLYADELSRLGFVADHTQKILINLKQSTQVLAAKGCGAMGADLCLILCYQRDQNQVIEELNKYEYKVALNTNNLVDCGVRVYEN